MTDDELLDEISNLIDGHSEGGYWDFKGPWPVGAELLHDIICMANNLEDRDAYIIIGVDESQGFSVVGVENDQHRKNTNQLTTFLRDKKFMGGMRPTALTKTFRFCGHLVDVVVVKNTGHTPYLVTEDYTDPHDSTKKVRVVRANSIYTRVNDTNTPIDKTADIDKIEYLWRKRFGIDKTAIQRLDVFLDAPGDWQYDDEHARFYYKYAPEFVIQITTSPYEEGQETLPPIERSEFYCKLFPDADGYHWEDFEVKYHQTVIYESNCAYLDGGRHLIVIPDRELIRASPNDIFSDGWATLYFYDLSSLLGKINRLFATHYLSGHDAVHSPLGKSVVTFRDTSEKDAFVEYLCGHLTSLEGVQTLAELKESHDDRSGDWPDIVEHWERDTMVAFSDLLDRWRGNTRLPTSIDW